MKALSVLSAIIAAGLLLGWLMTNRPVPEPNPAEDHFLADDQSSDPPPPILEKTTASESTRLAKRARLGYPAASGLITNWQDRLEEILNSEDEPAEQVNQMLQVFPRFPAEGQVELAQHLGSLLPDRDYGVLASYVTNSTLAESVSEALFAGLLDRPNQIKLPLLLGIARDEQHPKSGEALDLLEALVGEDFGTDWEQWSVAVEQQLESKPGD